MKARASNVWQLLAGMLVVLCMLTALAFVGRRPSAPSVVVGAASTGQVLVVSEALVLSGTGAGVDTQYTDPLAGMLHSIYIDYTGSITNTCDITVSYTSPLGGQILAVVSNVTDGMYYPRASAVTNANGAITDSHVEYALNGPLTVQVGQTTPGAVGTMRFLVSR